MDAKFWYEGMKVRGPARSTRAAADEWNLGLALQHLLRKAIVIFGCPLFFKNRICAKVLKVVPSEIPLFSKRPIKQWVARTRKETRSRHDLVNQWLSEVPKK